MSHGPYRLSPPPIGAPMTSPMWTGWFSKINNYLQAQGRIVDQQTLTAAASYTSPELEDGFRYELTFGGLLSSASNFIVFNFHNASGIVKSASTHHHWGTQAGAAVDVATLYAGQLSSGTAVQEMYCKCDLLHARNTTKKSTMHANYSYMSGASYHAADMYIRRTTAEDNLKFSLSSVSNFTSAWTAAGTMTGELILTRYPFKEQ